MGILARIRRLVEANIRDLVEKSQDPEVRLLDYAAEVERCCGEVKAELVDSSNEGARLERQLLETQEQARSWERKAETAVRRGEDDLAREALSRKARAEALAAHVSIHLQEQLDLADSFQKTLRDLSGKLQETRDRRDELLARADQADAASRVGEALKTRGIWTCDPSMERLAEDILERRARAEAYQKLYSSTLDAELRRLAGTPDVEAELKRLKEKI